MTLKEKLADDLKSAMKDKDVIRKNTVQMVRASILQVEKDNKVVLSDDEVLQVIAKELKKRRDAMPDFERSGREDLIRDLKKEIDILLEYLPKQLSMEEIQKIVKDVIQETGSSSIKDMGKVIPKVREITKASANGKIVSEVVKKFLS